MKKIDIEEVKKRGKFAVILTCLLSKKHMTQMELADAIGMSYATMTNYARGKFTPSQKNLLKICEALDVNPQVFYGSIDEFTDYLSSMKNIFSEKFKGLVKKSGETQEQISEAIGVSRQAVSYYINGKMMPMEDVLKKIAEHFNVSVDYLIEEDSDVVHDEGMRIVVTEMPKDPSKCKFIISDYTNDYPMCKLGGICKLNNGRCPHLCTLGEANTGIYLTSNMVGQVITSTADYVGGIYG